MFNYHTSLILILMSESYGSAQQKLTDAFPGYTLNNISLSQWEDPPSPNPPPPPENTPDPLKDKDNEIIDPEPILHKYTASFTLSFEEESYAAAQDWIEDKIPFAKILRMELNQSTIFVPDDNPPPPPPPPPTGLSTREMIDAIYDVTVLPTTEPDTTEEIEECSDQAALLISAAQSAILQTHDGVESMFRVLRYLAHRSNGPTGWDIEILVASNYDTSKLFIHFTEQSAERNVPFKAGAFEVEGEYTIWYVENDVPVLLDTHALPEEGAPIERVVYDVSVDGHRVVHNALTVQDQVVRS